DRSSRRSKLGAVPQGERLRRRAARFQVAAIICYLRLVMNLVFKPYHNQECSDHSSVAPNIGGMIAARRSAVLNSVGIEPFQRDGRSSIGPSSFSARANRDAQFISIGCIGALAAVRRRFV